MLVLLNERPGRSSPFLPSSFKKAGMIGHHFFLSVTGVTQSRMPHRWVFIHVEDKETEGTLLIICAAQHRTSNPVPGISLTGVRCVFYGLVYG